MGVVSRKEAIQKHLEDKDLESLKWIGSLITLAFVVLFWFDIISRAPSGFKFYPRRRIPPQTD